MLSISPLHSDVAVLRETLAGSVVLPDEDGWDAARQAWNLAADQRPALVALPAVAQAQTVCAQQNTCSLVPTATLTIPRIVRMQVPSLAITLDGSAITDISGGASVIPGTFGDVNVRANAAWNLTLAANSANWTYVGTAGGVRAATIHRTAANG